MIISQINFHYICGEKQMGFNLDYTVTDIQKVIILTEIYVCCCCFYYTGRFFQSNSRFDCVTLKYGDHPYQIFPDSPKFWGPVPKKYKVIRDAELSRIPNPVSNLSRFSK